MFEHLINIVHKIDHDQVKKDKKNGKKILVGLKEYISIQSATCEKLANMRLSMDLLLQHFRIDHLRNIVSFVKFNNIYSSHP
jgi:hypothetical protein